MYLFYPGNHYDLVGSTVKPPSNPSSSDPKDKAGCKSGPNFKDKKARDDLASWVHNVRNVPVWEEYRFHRYSR